MTNLLTRRLALFRIATVAGAGVVAAAPVALTAVQPKNPESPELIELGQHMIAKAQECLQLRQVRDDARALVMSSWPVLPRELCIGKYRDRIGTSNEEDCDDQPINRGGPYHLSNYEHYHGSHHLKERLAELPERGGASFEKRERQTLKQLLPIATAYESAKSAAMDAHDYRNKVERYDLADFDVMQTLRRIAALPALTPDGITVKAQAYQACSTLGKEGKFQAAIHLGPGLAEDICRVLADGDVQET